MRSPRSRSAGSASRSIAVRPCPPPMCRHHRKKPQRTARTPPTTGRDGRACLRAGTAAGKRQRGRGLGVDQQGAGGVARRLRADQRRRRLAAQHRGRGVRGGPGLLRGVRRWAEPRPGHGPRPRGPARASPGARVALGRGQPLPRRARRWPQVGDLVFPGELIRDDDSPPRTDAELVRKGR